MPIFKKNSQGKSNQNISSTPTPKNSLLPTEEIITIAKKAGVNFGPGSANERIRYFIKLRLLPYAVRKVPDHIENLKLKIKNSGASAPIGHLPYWTIERLVEINNLNNNGLTFPQIAKMLKAKGQTLSSTDSPEKNLALNQANLNPKPYTLNPNSQLIVKVVPLTDVNSHEINQKFKDQQKKLESLIDNKFKEQGQITSFHSQDLTSPTRSSRIAKNAILLVIVFSLASGTIFIGLKGYQRFSNTNSKATKQVAQDFQASGQVLAASSANNKLYIDADSEFTGTTLFKENITAPNLVYSVRAGTGIAVSAGQNPTVSLNTAAIVPSINSASGPITLKGSGSTSITNSGGTITISSSSSTSGITSEADTLSTVTGRGATTSTATSFTGGATVGTSLNLSYSSAAGGVAYLDSSSNLKISAAGTSSQCLLSGGTGAPTWGSCSGSGGVTQLDSLTGALTLANSSGSGTTVTIDDATTAAKGIASFSSSNFSTSSGAVSIKSGGVTTTEILDGTIANADISTSAAIALSKLASGTSAQIIVANGSGVPTYVTASGDVTNDNTGAFSIGTGKITSAMILDGTVSNTDLANSSITFAADSGVAAATSLGGTRTIAGSSPIATSISSGTITIACSTCLTSSSGVTTATGTANQVLVNGDTSAHSGAITLTLPQDIATTSTPTFAGMTLTSTATTSSAQTITANSLTSGNALNITSNSPSATTDYLINLASTGASNSAVRYGLFSSATGTGTTSTNYGIFSTASGATNNYAFVSTAGGISNTLTTSTSEQFVISATTNTKAAGGIFDITATSATDNNRGINLNYTYSNNSGATNGYGIYGSVTHSNSSVGNNLYGQYLTLTDSIDIDNTDFGQAIIVNKSGNPATSESTYGTYSGVTSSGNGAPTSYTYGMYGASNNTVVASGSAYGYGGYFSSTGNSTTSRYFGIAATASAGAFNYGLFSTVASAAGNYALYTTAGNIKNILGASDNVFISATANTTTNGVLELSTTNTANAGATQYGIYNNWTSSTAVTSGTQSIYGDYSAVTKTGADNSSNNTMFATYGIASNTGSANTGTKNTYGAYFSATGDTNGTSATYGVYTTAASADNNYSLYATGTYAGYFVSNSATTTGTVTITANNLTSGTALDVEGTSNGATGNLVYINGNGVGSYTSLYSGHAANCGNTCTNYNLYLNTPINTGQPSNIYGSYNTMTDNSPSIDNNAYGSYISLTKTSGAGAGNSQIGEFINVSSTGTTAGSPFVDYTYGIYANSVGSSNSSINKSYGVYVTASGADSNYGVFSSSANATNEFINSATTTAFNLSSGALTGGVVDIQNTTSTNLAGTLGISTISTTGLATNKIYGIYNTWTSTTAITNNTGGNVPAIGIYNYVTKTGTDTNSNSLRTNTLYGIYNVVSYTNGSTGALTKISIGGYFDAQADSSASANKAYGLMTNATTAVQTQNFGIMSTANSALVGNYAGYFTGTDANANASTLHYGVYAGENITGDVNGARDAYGVFSAVTNDNTTTDQGTRTAYGLYSSVTGSTRGTNTTYGAYLAAQSGDTNYGLVVAAGITSLSGTSGDGLVGAGLTDCSNATTSKLLYTGSSHLFSCGTDQTTGGGAITGSGTAGQIAFFSTGSAISSETSGFGWDTTNKLFTLTSTTATSTAALLTASSVTTGSALSIVGPTSTGVTTGTSSGFVKIATDVGSAGTGGSLLYLAPDFSAGSATTSYGLLNAATDATAIANTDYANFTSLTLTGDAAKAGYGYYGITTSNSATADSLYGGYFKTSATSNIGRTTNYGSVSYGQTTSTTGDTVVGSMSYGLSTGANTTAKTIYGAYNIAATTNATVWDSNNYGTFSLIPSPGAIASAGTFTSIATYGSVTKSGADTSSGNYASTGTYGIALNNSTDGSGTSVRTTYGGYFSATGASAGTTTTYGVFASASGADTNYSLYTLPNNNAASGSNYGILLGNIGGASTSNFGISIGTLGGAASSSVYGINTGTLTAVASGTNIQLNLGPITNATSSLTYGINVGSITGAVASTATYGINIGTISETSGTAEYGLNIGAVSGSDTSNYGINIATLTSVGTNSYGLAIGGLSGASTTVKYGTFIGNISGTSVSNYGLALGTLTGGSTNNIQIQTGAITDTGTLNIGLDLGGLSGTVNSSTNYGIRVGTITSAGTTSNNYGLFLGNVSGGTTNNYGIVASVTSAAGNYALYTTAGNIKNILGASDNVFLSANANTTTNGILEISATNTATAGATQYGIYNNWISSTAVTSGTQSIYGDYSAVTKTGADTSANTMFATYGIASNTGASSGTKLTYGGYFSATGDTNGTSTAYGVYTTASGATTNYPLFLATTQPASVSGGNGTNADAIMGISAAAGGNSTATSSTVSGGIGSGISLTLGTGGTASVAVLNNNGGAGGAITLTSGAGGASGPSTGTAPTSTGGAGGAITLTGGTGGVAGNSSGTNTASIGGAGGDITLTGGNGGTFGTASSLSTGRGGNINLVAGSSIVGGCTVFCGTNGAINLTTNTGIQTFTSSVATGTTTSSAFVFNASALTTGTAQYLTSATITTGKLLDINTASANTLTTGTLLNIASTSTAGTASTSDYLANLSRSGANAGASHLAYGLASSVTNTGTTSTNYALFATASGGTNNYGIFSNSAAATNQFTTSANTVANTTYASYVSSATMGAGAGDKGFANCTTGNTVTFSDPQLGGTTATGTATVSGGLVTAIVITNSGSGYTSAPTITISQGTCDTTPAATANLTAYGLAGGTVNIQNSTATTGVSTLNVSTINTANAGSTSYGIYNRWISANGWSGTSSAYGQYNLISKSGANSGLASGKTLYGSFSNVVDTSSSTQANTKELYAAAFYGNNTGGNTSGSQNTYGVYASANSDTSGTSTNYGVYVEASGGDTNYGLYIGNGDVAVKNTSQATKTTADAANASTCAGINTNTTTRIVYNATTPAEAYTPLTTDIIYNSSRTPTKHARITSTQTCVDGSGSTFRVIVLTDTIASQAAGDSITIYTPVSNLGSVFSATPGASSSFFNQAYIIKGVFVNSDSISTSTAGFDLAEQYSVDDSTIEPGDVVSLNPQKEAFVTKSTGTYDAKLLGVVATAPGMILGDQEGDNIRKVSLAGRAPVKVSAENGPIEAGDLLTSSSTPGIAMKADPTKGTTIGQALSAFAGPGAGTVTAFIANNSRYNLKEAIKSFDLQAQSFETLNGNTTIDPQGNITTAGNVIAGGTLSVAGGQFTVDSLGNVQTSGSITAQSLNILGDATIGANLTVNGELKTNNLTAISGSDLSISLGDSAGSNSLKILDSTNHELLTINTKGALSLSATNASLSVPNGYICVNNSGTCNIANPVNGTVYADNFSTAATADLAEHLPTKDSSIEAGDIVAADPNNSQNVIKSNVAYQNTLLGIISTAPGVTLNSTQVDGKPLALAGRVPVKVSLENGFIKTGDPITSSSVAGIGMKASQAGRVIGIALENFGSSQCNNITISQCNNVATITVFVNPSWYTGTALAANGSIQTQDQALSNNTNPKDLALAATTNPDGTLASAPTNQNKQLTETDIKQIVDNQVDAKIDSLIASGKLQPTSYASSVASAKDGQISTPVPTNAVLGESTASAQASSSATPEASTAAAIQQGAQIAAETDATLNKLTELLNTKYLILDTLSITGTSNLAQTQVAGTFSQDGTFVIDYGKQLNVLGNTLFVQNDVFAGNNQGILVDIGAGAVTIDKQGNIRTQGELSSSKLTTKELVIDTSDVNAKTVGSATIGSGQQSITIFTTAIKPNAKVLLTPTGPTGGKALYVATKSDFEGFTVTIDGGTSKGNISFDWLIVNTKQLSSNTTSNE